MKTVVGRRQTHRADELRPHVFIRDLGDGVGHRRIEHLGGLVHRQEIACGVNCALLEPRRVDVDLLEVERVRGPQGESHRAHRKDGPPGTVGAALDRAGNRFEVGMALMREVDDLSNGLERLLGIEQALGLVALVPPCVELLTAVAVDPVLASVAPAANQRATEGPDLVFHAGAGFGHRFTEGDKVVKLPRVVVVLAELRQHVGDAQFVGQVLVAVEDDRMGDILVEAEDLALVAADLDGVPVVVIGIEVVDGKVVVKGMQLVGRPEIALEDIGDHHDVGRGSACQLQLQLVMVFAPGRALKRRLRVGLLFNDRGVVVPERPPPRAEPDRCRLGSRGTRISRRLFRCRFCRRSRRAAGDHTGCAGQRRPLQELTP